MASGLRTVGAIIAGIAAAVAVFIAVEIFSGIVHPLPPGFGDTMEEMCAHVANYPHWVLGTVVPMWGFLAYAGTSVAGWLGNRISVIMVAAVVAIALLGNIFMLPYPVWFKIVQPIAILIGLWLGARNVARVSTP